MKKEQKIKSLVNKTLSKLGFEGDVSVEKDGERLRVDIQTNDASMLIGRGGESLRALQHLLVLAASRETEQIFGPGEFVLDINNYQRERENYLVALAKNTAYEVRETKRPKELEPMPASERRIIHITVENVEGVLTDSTGDRRDRRVTVRPVI